jgi:hypothetical protein
VGPLNTVPKKKCTTCRQKARASILPRIGDLLTKKVLP